MNDFKSSRRAVVVKVETERVYESSRMLQLQKRTSFKVVRDGVTLASFKHKGEAERFAAKVNG